MRSSRLGVLSGLAAAAAAVSITRPAIIQVQEFPMRRVALSERRESQLNRSRHWNYAETYKEARAMSPTPWTPVR